MRSRDLAEDLLPAEREQLPYKTHETLVSGDTLWALVTLGPFCAIKVFFSEVQVLGCTVQPIVLERCLCWRSTEPEKHIRTHLWFEVCQAETMLGVSC